ncbi:MAG: glycosyltransferase family 4 protein [Acidimicrobiales bacterium]
MKILMSVNDLAPIGGVEINVLEIGKELSRRGNEIDMLYLRGGILEDDYRLFCRALRRVPSFAFSSRRALRDLRGMAPAVLTALRLRPDVVFVNHFEEIVYGTLSSRPSRAPLVCHLQWMSVSHHRPVRLMSRAVHRFVAVSEYMRDRWVEAGVDPGRIVVVPNGVDLAAYPLGGEEELKRSRHELGLPDEAFVVLYCGRIDMEKGVEVLLDAWWRMGISPDNARLVLAGSPVLQPAEYLDNLRAQAPPGCHWFAAQRDVVTLMHAADLVVLPSIVDEAAGRVVLEAMATGRPVIASRSGGIPEVLDGDFARLLVTRGDASELAERLLAFADWRRREPQLGAACRAHVAQRFTLDRTVNGIEQVLFDVVGRA